MPLFKYIGAYERFVEKIGAVKPGDVVELLEKLPGYEWIAHEVSHSTETPPAAPESNAEPVSASPATNETPEIPNTPAVIYGPNGPVPASAPVAAVVH